MGPKAEFLELARELAPRVGVAEEGVFELAYALQAQNERGAHTPILGSDSAWPQFELQLHVKDPDAFHELYGACSEEGQKFFEFAEYATINLTVDVVDGLPVIKSAEFVK